MLRVHLGPNDATPWVLSEDELLSQIDRLAVKGFAEAPSGPVAVEAVDELGRVQWRASYSRAADLAILARQIREGRKAFSGHRLRERP